MLVFDDSEKIHPAEFLAQTVLRNCNYFDVLFQYREANVVLRARKLMHCVTKNTQFDQKGEPLTRQGFANEDNQS